LERENALMFGNQTFLRLDAYRPVEGEAVPEMAFDFSQASANDRWAAGRLDMEEALLRHDAAKAAGELVTTIRRQ
jgi:hypothetical protein